jgi:hypothetical protein
MRRRRAAAAWNGEVRSRDGNNDLHGACPQHEMREVQAKALGGFSAARAPRRRDRITCGPKGASRQSVIPVCSSDEDGWLQPPRAYRFPIRQRKKGISMSSMPGKTRFILSCSKTRRLNCTFDSMTSVAHDANM